MKKSNSNQEQLFQKNLSNWMQQGDAKWQFEGKEIIGTAKDQMGYIVTNKKYKNFLLELEFHPSKTVNSGIFLRCKTEEMSAVDCHEINIWDLHPNQDFRTGAIVTKVVPFEKVHTLNKWNKYKIRCADNKVEVWVNEVLTATYEDQTMYEGVIGLQAAGEGVIKFRNVQLTQM